MDANKVKAAVQKMLTSAPELAGVRARLVEPGEWALTCEFVRPDGSRAQGCLRRTVGWKN